MDRRSFKLTFLYFSRLFGLFYLSRHVSRRALRILCYHGFALADEHLFRPSLFVKPDTFVRRLEFLRDHHFSVMTLESALGRLQSGDLPDRPTVITIDDGFYSTYRVACGLLKSFSFPATLYVTTYHCVKETPVFRLVVQYMFWKTQRRLFDMSKLDSSFTGTCRLTDKAERDRTIWSIIEFGERAANEDLRLSLEKRLGELLGVDFEVIDKTRVLSLVTREEIRAFMADGVDIQLHTHRHGLPLGRLQADRELKDNKAILEPLVGNELHHFCYPSGQWSQEVWPVLAGSGIRSAVTCDQGFNYPHTPVFALNRFLDGEHITQIEFEAELSGYLEVLRRFWVFVKKGRNLVLWR